MFNKVSVYDLPYNVFEEVAKNCFLISAKAADGKVNAMTAGWGMMGNIWGKEAVSVYIRQSRYTKELIDGTDYFTLSLFDGGHKQELGPIFGRKSGRDVDKIAEAGFHLEMVEDQPTFTESKCVLICKKMYQSDIRLEDIPENLRACYYEDGDYHTMYVAEVVGCYVQ